MIESTLLGWQHFLVTTPEGPWVVTTNRDLFIIILKQFSQLGFGGPTATGFE